MVSLKILIGIKRKANKDSLSSTPEANQISKGDCMISSEVLSSQQKIISEKPDLKTKDNKSEY
ncbi:hypothetical protein [Elizabethkingia anophelis]|uniref:hypothetical protein n=1 Tax=Elizabethkingia anophelis TaxID=1117645 RepID=UPI00301BD53F